MAQIPTQITFRGFPHSDALEADVRERAAWIEQFYDGIVSCRVTVELPHRHRQSGRHFHVRIELTVPERPPIVVSHEPSLHAGAKDLGDETHQKDDEIEAVNRYAHVAVHQAFDTARRQLQDVAREQRGVPKTHTEPSHGRVDELVPIDGYGFIQTDEGRVYFTRAAVLDDGFDRLEVGTPVAFVEEKGEKGPQASTVRVLGTHHYVAP